MCAGEERGGGAARPTRQGALKPRSGLRNAGAGGGIAERVAKHAGSECHVVYRDRTRDLLGFGLDRVWLAGDVMQMELRIFSQHAPWCAHTALSILHASLFTLAQRPTPLTLLAPSVVIFSEHRDGLRTPQIPAKNTSES